MFKVLFFVLVSTLVFAQDQTRTKTKRQEATLPITGVVNNIRVFPLNLLESSFHAAYERRIMPQVAVGFEGLQTLGDSKALLYPDVEFQETYFGPLGQYYIGKNFEGLFFEGGLNFARAKISANAGLRGEKVTKEQSYIMPHATANYRMRTQSGLTATMGAGLFAFYGGDELKIEENKRGFVDGAYVEKSTKVETPYSSSPKLRLRVDLGYTF